MELGEKLEYHQEALGMSFEAIITLKVYHIYLRLPLHLFRGLRGISLFKGNQVFLVMKVLNVFIFKRN